MEVISDILIEKVADIAGDSIYRCYQCQKCSSGCPVAEFMDYLPAEIIRLVQLGFREKALSSKTIWVCASCEICTTRCPNEVDIAMTMDVLREECLSQGYQPPEKDVLMFHRIFLSSIRSYGKIHELGMIKDLKMKSGRYFEDLILGMSMFKKRKIKLFPHRIKGISDIKKILKDYSP